MARAPWPGRFAPAAALSICWVRPNSRRPDGRTASAKATTIRWRDGRRVDSDQVGTVLNLIPALPALGFDAAGDRDRVYAQGEQQAMFVSFLAGLDDRLIGGVDGQGPTGMWSWARWASLAHRCGMPTAVSRQAKASLIRLVVGGGRCPELQQAYPFPPLTVDIADAVADLMLARNARSVGTREAS